jgi:hypothetical protein
MRWRIILALSIIGSILLYRWLPIDSELAKFLLAGIFFSISSQIIALSFTYIATALPKYNSRQVLQEASKEIETQTSRLASRPKQAERNLQQ